MDFNLFTIKNSGNGKKAKMPKHENSEIVYYPYSRRDWYFPSVSLDKQNGLIKDQKGSFI